MSRTQMSDNQAPENWMQHIRLETEVFLKRELPDNQTAPRELHEAMRYAVLEGGKRLRSLLCHAAGYLYNAPPEALLVSGAAIELMHASSLVHDDLPAMDNDSLRRARATVHVQYDEATAILVGDALQTQAFITLGHVPLPAARRVLLMAELALAAGSQGMAGGQMIDLISTGSSLNQAELEQMHQMKTGALLRAAVRLGALCGVDTDNKELLALDGYAKAIGLAFQIVDDILDATMDSATIGKTAGKDAKQAKPTYISVIGLDESKKLIALLITQAHAALADYGAKADRLRQLTDVITRRCH
ncbi:(2E,6E)-farnesyl diphosphate synthase [Pseudomonas chlororaphis subsp. aurantiaca]|nr:(2E,6E)-farnesyl diphosphate synthase [Pseudomonas chlororaphis subsp. aurantiaca]